VRSGGTDEVVTDGVDGILFEPGDFNAAAHAMQALALDPDRLLAMSRDARALNRSRYEIGTEVEEVVGVLLDAVGQCET
jgi:glycosyltransferase involved in cell wall biosynthesis